MKGNSEEIDRLFREGFREEEQYAPEIPEDRFETYFPANTPESGKSIFLRRHRISIAASILLAALSLSWLFSGKTSEKSPENSLALAEPQAAILTDASLPAEQEKPANKDKTLPKETTAPKEKGKKSAKPGARNRRRRIGATMFPGIFPTPLFDAQQKVANADKTPENQTVPAQETVQEVGPETTAFTQENPLPDADGNEVVAVEFHPELPVQNVEISNEPPAEKQKNRLRMVLEKARQLNFSSLPSVDEAKGILISSIGRFIGQENQDETEANEKSNSNEL